jgi:hypothetical protein
MDHVVDDVLVSAEDGGGARAKLAAAVRYDAARLGRAQRTPQGFLKIPAYLTRAGVLTYRQHDGTTVRELRPQSEVFAPASLATLSAAPITDMHPGEMVSADNVRQHAIGHVHDDVRADGYLVSAWITIQDGKAVAAVERGDRHELSCGYRCQIDRTPGTFEGQRYDQVQRDIVYNHVALGPKGWGRAGPEIGLRMDSACAVSTMEAPDDDDTSEVHVDDDDQTDADSSNADGGADRVEGMVWIDGVETQGQEIFDALGELKIDHDELADENETLRGQLEGAQAELDTLRAERSDGATRRDSADYRRDVQEHAALLATAMRHLPSQQLDASYGPREIQVAVLTALDPKLDLRGADDVYVRGRFDAVTAALARYDRQTVSERRDSAIDQSRAVLAPQRAPSAPRAGSAAQYTPDWQRPLSTSRSTQRREDD